MEKFISNRYFKTFSEEVFLMKKLKRDELFFYLDIKNEADYGNSETRKRGTLTTTHRILAQKYGHSVSKTQKILSSICNAGLCETENKYRGRSKIGTIITFCFYDSCKNKEEYEVALNMRSLDIVKNCNYDSYNIARPQKMTKGRSKNKNMRSRYIIDRKNININPDKFSNENFSCPLRKGEQNFSLAEANFENLIYAEMMMNLKNENEELKKRISNLENSLKNFFEILKNENFDTEALKNSTLNTEKIKKERKSCGKKKNTAVLSDFFAENDKLYQSGGEIAPEGLKMAKNGNSQKFVPPTLQEVEEYCKERRNGVDAEMFVNFYESKGWVVGKTKMKNWRACVRTWEQKNGYSKEKALNTKNRDDWQGDNELRFKENLKLVTNSTQWRDFSNQAYVDFNRDDKIAYYNEFIMKFANDTRYSEIFYDDDLQTKIKEHFLNFLNTKLVKKQEFKERQKNYLNKPQEKTFMQRTAERMEQAGMFSLYDKVFGNTKDKTNQTCNDWEKQLN